MKSWKDRILAFICVSVFLGFLVVVLYRTADVYYKAAWIVTHFPPTGTICSEPFCVRTDTTKPGRRFGELHFAYCPEHLSGGFQGRGGRSAAVAVLGAIFMLLFSLAAIPIMGALFRIAAWPILIPLRLAGKLPPGQLIPFSNAVNHGRAAPGDWLEPAGMCVGAILALIAVSFYCWW